MIKQMASRWSGAIALYIAFAVFIGYFSTRPAYVQRPPSQAAVKLALSHQGQLKRPCRRRSPDELAELAPNMRRPMDCPRERWPVRLTLSLDGETVYERTVAPTGFSRDGTSYAYDRLRVPAGDHEVALAVWDSGAGDAEPYARTEKVRLTPGQVLVVEFVDGAFRFTTG